MGMRDWQGEHDKKLAADKAAEAKKMDKYAAAAKIAQQAGGLPSDGELGGAVSGAATGAAFGAPGMAVGAVAGAVMGAAQSRAAAKAHNAKLEANKLAALGKIEEEKGKNISNALGSMGMRMGAGFR